jgi:membrane protein DedA with SNARE-associated domain
VREIFEFLARHGYWALFITVLAEQLGLPFPAVPILVAAGALAGLNQISAWYCIAVAVFACLLSDSVWYWMGRKRGQSVLKLLCRISLEPESCVTQAKDWFGRMGNTALVVAKFIPGFSTAAPPMAGVNRMPLLHFLLLDAVGSFAWAGLSVWAGFLFRNQMEAVLESANRIGSSVGVALFAALAGYVALKWYQSRRFVRNLHASRISPAELYRRTKSGESVAILDLRGRHELEEIGAKIPGALWFSLADLETRHREIPRDREIILYCS